MSFGISIPNSIELKSAKRSYLHFTFPSDFLCNNNAIAFHRLFPQERIINSSLLQTTHSRDCNTHETLPSCKHNYLYISLNANNLVS